MAHTNKIPEGIFFVSSQGHWRYGNNVCDEEWVIPEAKIKVDESSLYFGRAITSNGKYTDITNKDIDTCFGITLEDDASRADTINDENATLSDTEDNDGYTTHIIQKGILRFVKSDFDDCFESASSSGIQYAIGQKIYLNKYGKFTNNLERIIESSWRIVELGEITNITETISNATDYIDLSVNIKNHNKIETDTARFVERTAEPNTWNLNTSDFGNKNICVFAWNSDGRVVPADIDDENRREVAGLYIGEITPTFESDIGGKQIELIRNGKIYLDEMPETKEYNNDGTIKQWNNIDDLTKGSQLYLERDGSVSLVPYLENDINGYTCPIMTYLGDTEDNKHIFYVDINRPEVRMLDDLFLLKTFTSVGPSADFSILASEQNTGSDLARISNRLDITEVSNYGNFGTLDELQESLDIHLYVKSSDASFANYIFYNKWVEVKPGFFHFDTVRSYGYIWRAEQSNNHTYLIMDIADGFGLSIESGKNSGPIVCNNKFDCKIIVKRFNNSELRVDLVSPKVQEYVVENNETTAERIIKSASTGKFIKADYDLNNHTIGLSGEANSVVTVIANTQTPSKANLKRVYDEDKFTSNLENIDIKDNIYASEVGADDATQTQGKNHFNNLGEAMRAIYETPLALWNYKTDPTTDKQKIGVIVDRLNERTDAANRDFGTRNLNGFEDNTANTFSYTNDEKEEIKKFIRLLTDTNEKGVDNTNAMGIVFKALKETQQRLLDLEAATFGITSSKLSLSNHDDSNIDRDDTHVNSNSIQFGLNRMVRALAFEIFGTANPSEEPGFEYDESSLSYFDFVEKLILGTVPTKNNKNGNAPTQYEPDRTADSELSRVADNGTADYVHEKNYHLIDQVAKYYSYDEEADPQNNGFETDCWGTEDTRTNESWANNKIYKFNGVEDAVYRLVNRANILTKMIFYDSNGNANKAPAFTDSILVFSHNKIHY